MIDRQALLKDLSALLKRLEHDLLLRSESADVPEVKKRLQADFAEATKRGRTALNYEDWRSDFIAQIAVAWVLSCVFARFLEDNGLVAPPRISGPGHTLQQARDEHESYFRQHPKLTDREYLLDVFAKLAALPGAGEVFGPHNPIHQLPNWLSGDAAGLLLEFFQKIDAASGALVHDFTDAAWDTRFLGDLYQDLSEATRKKYALLQTPHFVEAFILDRTLEPALDTLGLEAEPVKDGAGAVALPGCFRMIDPACGSGHFLLGAFARILDRWQRKEPATNVRTLVQRTLDSIYGVDLNPYAVAIARFRLLLVALHASGVKKLKDAPNFKPNLACGDSLLHGQGRQHENFQEQGHTYASEDKAELSRILRVGAYHAVVANPPYITPKDKAANEAYRERYESCHMKYSLAAPFMERIFRLAVEGGANADKEPAGFTGQITANSFMKREFGKKLIESFLPKIDLTHVIDTSGAYIPGHGTPTVILFGRNRKPLTDTIRTVMGIRGEPSTPADPAQGKVWTAITTQVDQPGSASEFVSANDSPRAQFHKHPWSIGGGGAAELKEQLDEVGASALKEHVESIGFMSISGEDDAFVAPTRYWHRRVVPQRLFGVGDAVRDWLVDSQDAIAFMYSNDGSNISVLPIDDCGGLPQGFWPFRATLRNRLMFGKLPEESGLTWYEYRFKSDERLRTPLSIVFGEVATHNHFVLDRGGKVFKQTAPVIKLKPGATEDDHLALLGLLNSSTACFWMKQVCHNKGSTVDQHGARQRTSPFEDFYALNGTNLQKFPLAEGRPLTRSRRLDELARQRHAQLPDALASRGAPTADAVAAAEVEAERILGQMIALQEELDWECYRLYRLIDDDLTHANPPGLQLGQRAFEIVLARKMAAGETETTWFTRHGSTPITELPADWPDDYKALVEKRIELIENDANIRLIEQPEYKRRWNTEPWNEQLERALRHWLLDRLESYFDFDGRMSEQGKPTALIDQRLISLAQLAEYAGSDPEFQQVGAIYRDDKAFNVSKLVSELVEAESVPLLPVLRYKDSGLRKRAEWERTWDLQRKEDAGEQVGTIPVPPKYTSADFKPGPYWKLRGKLDVPKERWISFPHCPDQDGTMTIAWAGLNHLQQANAIAAFFVDVQERQGGSEDPRLEPLLAGLCELLPWLKQWHNEIDPKYQQRMGDYFEGFIAIEARKLGKTPEQVRAWTTAKKGAKTHAKKASKAAKGKAAPEEE